MTDILRPGLLDGVTVVVDGPGAPGSRLAGSLERGGARLGRPGDPAADALVLDCTGWSAAGGEVRSLLELLDGAWAAVVGVAVEGFIAAGRPGRILFVAPVDRAAAAALENLSRTLSVEWARHSITAVTLVPSPTADPDHLSTVVAYLLSPAGAYFSGTRLELGSLSL